MVGFGEGQRRRQTARAEIPELFKRITDSGRSQITGQLLSVENDEAIVQADQEEYLLPLENVQRARLMPQFD